MRRAVVNWRVTTVAILSPGFPRTPGGVTDHTARLMARWQARDIAVHVADLSRLDLALAAHALLIQYVPFLYGRRGLSPELGALVDEAGRRAIRVTLFVHEPWVPPTRLPWLVLSPLQRRQLSRLARAVQELATPVPAWQAMLPRPSTLLYVGSTLGRPDPVPPAQPPLPAPVVFSPFAAGLNWGWIAAAEQAIGAGLVVLGCTVEEGRARLRRLPARAKDWTWISRADPPSVLGTLARARLALAPYVDGLTGRRTAALACLSVGTPLVSSRGPLFDPVFEAPATMLASGAAEFAACARDRWTAASDARDRADRRAWFAQHFDPDVLDDRLLALCLGDTP